MAKTSPNPYDRRAPKAIRDRFGEEVMLNGGSFDLLADGRRAYPGFGLDRLQDLLRDEFARGYNAGEGTFERMTEEETLPRVRRQVWAEGRASGHGDGERAVLERASELFEALATELHTDLADALKDENTGPEVMRSLAARSARLLKQMIDAHHKGFEPEPPF
jgi:hypothetical protein